MDGPLVSVIVPVFNTEAYLGECVDSLLRQRHAHLEVVLVDDGSTDASPAICDAYRAADPRVRVIHQENRGLSDARNAGIAAARGAFITFVDSDDSVHEDLVADLLQLAREHSAEVAASGFTSDPARLGASGPATVTRVLSVPGALEEYLGPHSTTMTVAWAKLYGRHLWDGLAFPSGRSHEDEFTTYRAVSRAERVVLTDSPLYLYRQRDGSLTNAPFNLRARLDRLDALIERAAFFEDLGLGRRAYRPVVDEQLTLFRSVHAAGDEETRARFLATMEDCICHLEGTGQPISFRLLAAAHLRFPALASRLYGRVVLGK